MSRCANGELVSTGWSKFGNYWTFIIPNAPKIKLVMDNLNTHSIASSIKRSSPKRPVAWLNGWRFITHRSMVAG
ncbi:hypothetical protein P7H15_13720 [Paenibacillus larvae]|nr:hypothetical protein [Paenibacillus larvae]MDT2293683.1 hypothetical protein [Paenibacillus larvae]